MSNSRSFPLQEWLPVGFLTSKQEPQGEREVIDLKMKLNEDRVLILSNIKTAEFQRVADMHWTINGHDLNATDGTLRLDGRRFDDVVFAEHQQPKEYGPSRTVDITCTGFFELARKTE